MTFAVLLSLGACKPQSSPSPEQEAAPVQAAAQSTSYNLRIVFRGLIGFAEDSGKVWALLVNAQYDPLTVTEDDLPPGVYHELGGDRNPRPADWLAGLNGTVPPHYASISFSNAKISGCDTCDPARNWRRPIFGADLHLGTGNPGQGTINLDALASACSIIKVREALGLKLENLAGLDQLDTSLLNPLPTASASLDRRLAARVEVEIGQGDNVSANLVPDKAKKIADYFFNRPSETTGCHGEHAQQLAEEVVVTRSGVTGPVTIRLGPEDEITVEPDGSGEDVIISILNQPQMPGVHPHAHRWFYRLLDRADQSMVEDHFYPCRRANFGPPDCPQKRFFTVKVKGSCS